MYLNILVIVALETLAVSCVLLGFIFGRYSLPPVARTKPIILDDKCLDPVSPEDQQLLRRFEEEGKLYGEKDSE